MKRSFLTLLIPLLAAAAFAADTPGREANCAAEDMQLLYYYLSPDPGPNVKSRPTACHGAKRVLTLPEWLEKSLPAMNTRLVWEDPEEGKLSEAQLWQTSFSILYELASKTRKTFPEADLYGDRADPYSLEADYSDIRLRFIMSLDRLTRTGLEKSFEGRGTGMLSDMNGVVEKLDALTAALAKKDTERFRKEAGAALKLSRSVFARLFAPAGAGAGARFTPKYTPEARILPGYRGVTVPVSGPQTLFLQKGDRVDFLVTFDAIMTNDVKEKITATILQNVVVLNVHRPAAPEGEGYVQLLVNPNEAQYASLSIPQSAALHITRRAPGDMQLAPMEVASFRKLMK